MRLRPVVLILLCTGSMEVPVYGMNVVTSCLVSIAKSDFFKRHTREFAVIVVGVVAVGVYKSFFSRLDRIESLVQEIEGKISATSDSVTRLDSAVRAEISSLLEKIKQLPNKQEMERMLLELRRILLDDQAKLAQQANQKLFDLESRLCDKLNNLERAVEEKLMRLEQKIDRYQNTVKDYQADVKKYQTEIDQGLSKVALKQKEIKDILVPDGQAMGLKQVTRQQK